ncbi:MAG: Toprim subdomain protein [Methanomassiliicoccales archaeon]|nr:Toprim subdomain protein [Methanomassiliicoccales archaeon]
MEELTWLLEELRDRPTNQVILVEGLKDRAALTVLGVGGEVWQVQGPNSIFSVAEKLAKEHKEAVILTDWDRKGGQLAQLLRSSLSANGIRFDDHIRMRLVILVKKDIKDIESLPAFYSRLIGLSQNPLVIEKFDKLKKLADRER